MPASYKIPQNVDLEDKIFGPLTLRQFLMALGTALAIFLEFNALYTLSRPAFIAIATVTAGTAVTFMFVRPNDQPFSRFFFAFLKFATTPQRRTWKRIPSLTDVKLVEDAPKVAPKATRPSAQEAKSRLQQLAHLVDTRGWDADDDQDDELTGRVVSDEQAKPKLNLEITDSDLPEDILEAEDESRGSDRTTAELDQLIKQKVAKPALTKADAGVHRNDPGGVTA